MDERRFDRLAKSMALRPTRRAALRLAANGLLGGLVSWRSVTAARAQDACGGCPPGHVCRGGACLVPAPPPFLDPCLAQGLRNCGGACVDLQEDARNCGACGVACGSSESCAEGRCFVFDDLNCAAHGFTNCGGTCVDLTSHSWHCGACGDSCPIGSFCDESECVSTGYYCTTLGLTECHGFCVDTMNDPDNCGGCQFACYVEGARCVNGNCVS